MPDEERPVAAPSRPRRRASRTAAAALIGLTAGSAAAAASLRPVAVDGLCVTNGAVVATADGRLHVETPSSRAVLRSPGPAEAEIDFRYLGPSADEKALSSGEMRRQIGLKLRAADTCNLVYVMWHIAPDARIAVSIKRNPGRHSHAECDAHGYVDVASVDGGAVAKIAAGEEHRLRAALDGSRLTVTADGKVAWAGNLGRGVQDLDGPVGMRSDNARFDFVFLAAEPDGRAATGHCARMPEH